MNTEAKTNCHTLIYSSPQLYSTRGFEPGAFPKKATTIICLGFCLHPYSMSIAHRNKSPLHSAVVIMGLAYYSLIYIIHTYI